MKQSSAEVWRLSGNPLAVQVRGFHEKRVEKSCVTPYPSSGRWPAVQALLGLANSSRVARRIVRDEDRPIFIDVGYGAGGKSW